MCTVFLFLTISIRTFKVFIQGLADCKLILESFNRRLNFKKFSKYDSIVQKAYECDFKLSGLKDKKELLK